mmetsp:Transcript_5452/g.7548  ORF Transcript_5452/g.7548 Transcript_5452/m.7548 type:complete len:241 (+) Transcript_5452:33-755(+)
MKGAYPWMYVLSSLAHARKDSTRSTIGCRWRILSRSSSEVEWCLVVLECAAGGRPSRSKSSPATCSGEARLHRPESAERSATCCSMAFLCSVIRLSAVERYSHCTDTPRASISASRQMVGISTSLRVAKEPSLSSCSLNTPSKHRTAFISDALLLTALATLPIWAIAHISCTTRILFCAKRVSSSKLASEASVSHKCMQIFGSTICLQSSVAAGEDEECWWQYRNTGSRQSCVLYMIFLV